MSIELQVLSGGEYMDTNTNEPYHLRAAIDGNEIRLAVVEPDGTSHTIVIQRATVLLGHPKTDGCCDSKGAEL